MAKKPALNPDDYKKSIQLILSALTHNATKARTAKESAEQVAHAQACESLANAFVSMYKPGMQKDD